MGRTVEFGIERNTISDFKEKRQKIRKHLTSFAASVDNLKSQKTVASKKNSNGEKEVEGVKGVA